MIHCQSETTWTKTGEKEKDQKHIKEAFCDVGKEILEEFQIQNILIPYVAVVSEDCVKKTKQTAFLYI